MVMTGPLLQGLPPIVDDGARLLILGNMPSVMSLAAQQYYANPRNGFWRITGEIFGFDASAAYDVRADTLRARGVAVWDVLRLCRRQGSLDSAVEPDSMVANDFAPFFDSHPGIERCSSTAPQRRRTSAGLSALTGRCATADCLLRAPPKPCTTRTSCAPGEKPSLQVDNRPAGRGRALSSFQ